MSCDLDGAPVFYSERNVKARREHGCCECGRTIRVGEEYMRCSGKWDGGDVATFKQHVACWTFARKLNLDILGECDIPFGGVNDALSGLDPQLEQLSPELVCELQLEWLRVRAGNAS